jgi:ubiquinol-cytochrome c reductase cytochrome c1 subunit
MKISMDAKQAKDWFGATPPDLTLIARSRADAHKGSGPDYLYTLWRSYYRDETKATGWNNLAFPCDRHAACAVGTAGRAQAGVRGGG